MKKRFFAAVLSAALLLSGCNNAENSDKTSNNSQSVNIVDLGSISSSSSNSYHEYSSEFSGGWNGITELPLSSSGEQSSDSVSSGSSASDVTDSGKPSVDTPSESSSPTTSGVSGSSAPLSSAASSGSSGSSTALSSSSTSSSSALSSESTSSATNSSSSSSSSSTDKPPQASNPVERPSGANTYKPLNYTEVKGVWISYLELMNMPSGSAAAFRSAIGEVFDNCVELGLNTVYVHARSHGDSYYNSDLFPYTKYLSGGFDALEIMVDEAHKRNLSFQAWINPLRGCSEKDISRANGYLIGDWIEDGRRAVNVGGTYFLNPAYDEVIKLIADGAREIVANYEVDGLHIDDYFYPTTDPSFDSEEFKASGYSDLSAFRFANCDKMVKALYDAVKASNPNAIFGVSCQGNLENNYTYMFADVKKWCSEGGYLDYIMPQIYFGFNNSSQPFAECVKQWNGIAASGNIPLIVGVSVSKVGYTDVWAGNGSNEWITDKDILRRQYLESVEQSEYGGISLYSYRSIFSPEAAVKDRVDEEISSLKAVLNQ